MNIFKSMFMLALLTSPTFLYGETVFRSVCYTDLQICGTYVIDSDTSRISQIFLGQYGGSVDLIPANNEMMSAYKSAGIEVKPLGWAAYEKVQATTLYHSTLDTTAAKEVEELKMIPDDAWDASVGFVYCGLAVGGCGLTIASTVESFGLTYWATKIACTTAALTCIDFSRKYQKWQYNQKIKAIDAKVLNPDGSQPGGGHGGSSGASGGPITVGGPGIGGGPPRKPKGEVWVWDDATGQWI